MSLRKIRIAFASLSVMAITVLFLDFTGTIHGILGWIAKVQFLPAILALNVGTVILLLLLTLLFGRVYCSVICPLGIFQDAVSRFKNKKNKYKYSSAISWLRYSILMIFILSPILGVSAIVSILEPYSAYGRIVSTLFSPIYKYLNNVLAYFAERANNYAFYEVDVFIISIETLIVAIVTLIVISVLAWKNGRTYCNTLCPVGTILGVFSKFSIYKFSIDTDKCNGCGCVPAIANHLVLIQKNMR